MQRLFWAISTLFRGTPRPNLDSVKGFIPIFKKALEKEKPSSFKNFDEKAEQIRNIIFSIGCICEKSFEGSQKIFEIGLVPILISFLDCKINEILSCTLRTIGNIIKEDFQPKIFLDLKILDYFLKFFSIAKSSIKRDVCWILSNLMATESCITPVIQSGLMLEVISTLRIAFNDVAIEACWCVSNASWGTEETVSYLVANGAIQAMKSFFERTNDYSGFF